MQSVLFHKRIRPIGDTFSAACIYIPHGFDFKMNFAYFTYIILFFTLPPVYDLYLYWK